MQEDAESEEWGMERWMVPPIPEMAILRLSKEEDYLLM